MVGESIKNSKRQRFTDEQNNQIAQYIAAGGRPRRKKKTNAVPSGQPTATKCKANNDSVARSKKTQRKSLGSHNKTNSKKQAPLVEDNIASLVALLTEENRLTSSKISSIKYYKEGITEKGGIERKRLPHRRCYTLSLIRATIECPAIHQLPQVGERIRSFVEQCGKRKEAADGRFTLLVSSGCVKDGERLFYSTLEEEVMQVMELSCGMDDPLTFYSILKKATLSIGIIPNLLATKTEEDDLTDFRAKANTFLADVSSLLGTSDDEDFDLEKALAELEIQKELESMNNEKLLSTMYSTGAHKLLGDQVFTYLVSSGRSHMLWSPYVQEALEEVYRGGELEGRMQLEDICLEIGNRYIQATTAPEPYKKLEKLVVLANRSLNGWVSSWNHHTDKRLAKVLKSLDGLVNKFLEDIQSMELDDIPNGPILSVMHRLKEMGAKEALLKKIKEELSDTEEKLEKLVQAELDYQKNEIEQIKKVVAELKMELESKMEDEAEEDDPKRMRSVVRMKLKHYAEEKNFRTDNCEILEEKVNLSKATQDCYSMQKAKKELLKAKKGRCLFLEEQLGLQETEMDFYQGWIETLKEELQVSDWDKESCEFIERWIEDLEEGHEGVQKGIEGCSRQLSAAKEDENDWTQRD